MQQKNVVDGKIAMSARGHEQLFLPILKDLKSARRRRFTDNGFRVSQSSIPLCFPDIPYISKRLPTLV